MRSIHNYTYICIHIGEPDEEGGAARAAAESADLAGANSHKPPAPEPESI